jgi:ABC-2 type transport system ATP-binding protein
MAALHDPEGPGSPESGAAGRDDVLLRAEGVTKRWNAELVLDDIALELRPGVITGVIGENGVGKTTLLRSACGVIVPDAGTIRFRGVDIERDRTRFQRAVGLLSAGDRGLYARLTVNQNLDFCAGLAGMSRRRRRERMDAARAEFDLPALAERRVDRLSMGQRQRVRMACMFLHEPLLVFLDEPRTSLDEAGVALLGDALKRLADRGGAALWVSHETDEPLVDDPWLLRDGRLHRIEGDDPAPDPVPSGALAS